MIIAYMYAPANPRMYTHDTHDTHDTDDTVSHLDSNFSKTVETPASTFFRMKDDANM